MANLVSIRKANYLSGDKNLLQQFVVILLKGVQVAFLLRLGT